MGDVIERNVKELINAFESVSQRSDVSYGLLKSHENIRNEEMPAPKTVSKYKELLQKELDELFQMRDSRGNVNNKEEGHNLYQSQYDPDPVSADESDGQKETCTETDNSFQNSFSRSKVLYSNSTISGKRPKRWQKSEIECRGTFIDTAGIIDTVSDTELSHAEMVKNKKKEDKLGKVIQEIVSSEKVYVRRLSLLSNTFRSELALLNRNEYCIQWESWGQMFSNLSNIHKFHAENLLPRLEACLESHFSKSDGQKSYVGKVFSDLGPYLKMYSEYAQNYKRYIDILDASASQSPSVQEFITQFEARDICEGLKIKYFYIEPIQRLPRYELLLREYTSCLSDDSDDLVNAHIALKLVKQANIHSNDSIRNEENFLKIKQIEDCLRDSVDLSGPSSRKFLREGGVDIVLPISGRVEERRLFLFNDLLLICQYYPHPFRPPYCVTNKLDINQFQVKEVMDRLYLFGPGTIIELSPKSSEDRRVWKEDLEKVAKNKESERINLVPKSSLIKKKQTSLKKSESVRTRHLGEVAPIMMKEQGVQACMECSEEFGLFNRKRSCYACGRIICATCSENKEPLTYMAYKMCRVCNKCSAILSDRPSLPRMF